MPKRVGTAHFFEKSYKNTRTRKRPPVRAAFFWCERWDSKGRPERSEGKKHAGGMFFRSWESLLRFETHPVGMWIKLESVRCRKGLVRRTFSKSPIRTLAPEKGRPSGRPFSGARDGTRKAGPSEARVKNMPVACFLGRGRVPFQRRRANSGAEKGRFQEGRHKQWRRVKSFRRFITAFQPDFQRPFAMEVLQ